MDPGLRNALLMTGLIFCGFFAAVTLYVIFDRGLRFETYGYLGALALYAVSLLIIGMIAAGLIGAIRNPPDEYTDRRHRRTARGLRGVRGRGRGDLVGPRRGRLYRTGGGRERRQ